MPSFVYLALGIAVLTETIGTMALQASEQFTRLVPSGIVIVSYALSFYFLSITLRSLPVGIVYALWSGLGIVLISTMGFVVYGQRLDLPAILGLGMIVAGIAVIQLYSDTTPH